MDSLEVARRWRSDASLFVREAFHAEPTPQQQSLLDLFSKGEKKAISIRSGHGTGKTAAEAWLIAWFLVTRPQSKVVCTAPTGRQLKDILWAEAAHWINHAIAPVKQLLVVKNEVISIQDRKDWFARAASINVQASAEEQAETLAGYHAEHLLAIVDEASGVPDPVFQPLRGYLTQEDNFVLLASNPTKPAGFFWSTFNDDTEAPSWTHLHWSSEDSPLVSKNYVKGLEKKGRNSNTFRIRVLGDFPIFAEDNLIPVSWIERATVDSFPEEKRGMEVWGLDVARFGSDSSALVKRNGTDIYFTDTKQGLDTQEVADWVADHYFVSEEKPSFICVDTTGGLGAGVSDRLRRILPSESVLDVNVSWSAFDKEHYRLLRDELYFRLRDALEQGFLRLPSWDKRLLKELSSIHYSFQNGKLKLEGKAAFKKRGHTSPDAADALALTFYFDRSLYAQRPRKRNKKEYHVSSWRVA